MLARQEASDDGFVLSGVCNGRIICDPSTGGEVCGSCGLLAR
jgi:hypothetical protein